MQDVVWTMRERGIDPATCAQIGELAASILSASSLRDPNDRRAQRLHEVLQSLERRITAMLDAATGTEPAGPQAPSEPDTPPPVEMVLADEQPLAVDEPQGAAMAAATAAGTETIELPPLVPARVVPSDTGGEQPLETDPPAVSRPPAPPDADAAVAANAAEEEVSPTAMASAPAAAAAVADWSAPPEPADRSPEASTVASRVASEAHAIIERARATDDEDFAAAQPGESQVEWPAGQISPWTAEPPPAETAAAPPAPSAALLPGAELGPADPAPRDPLAALMAMSDEERIALFT
jgi:hypothetical protein